MLILVLTASAEALALILRLTAKNAYAMWALALSTAPMLLQVGGEIREGLLSRRWMTDSNAELLGFELTVLALTLLPRGRFSCGCFWSAWGLNLSLIALITYVMVQWRPFA